MSSDKNTRKFPRGYDVTIVRKEDVLEAIDDNIIDKEIALDLIKQLELDASNFIKEGRWTSLPFIGTIRYNENKKAIIDNIDVVRQAEKTMSKQEYVMFRKKLVTDNLIENKYLRHYNYLVSMSITDNRKLYNYYVENYGESYARLMMYFFRTFTCIEETIEPV